MSKLEFNARVSWTRELIVSDWTLTGQPPGHSERSWSDVEAWGVGRPAPTQVDGLWLLMKHAPYYHFISNRSVGVIALEGELRKRGCSERPAGEIKAAADARALRDLRAEVGTLFGDAGEEVWQALETPEVLRMVNVRSAVVRLSKGDRAKLEHLIATAKQDPRDVLHWAQSDHLI
jgi:hypothetical protein